MNKTQNSKNILPSAANSIGGFSQNVQLDDSRAESPLGNKIEVVPANVNLPVQAGSSDMPDMGISRRDAQETPQVELSEEDTKIKANQGKILDVLSQYCTPVSIPENEFGIKSGMRLDVYSTVEGLKKKWDALVEKGELTKENRDAQVKEVEDILNLVKDKEDISLVRMFTESFFGKDTNFYKIVDKTSGGVEEKASENEKEDFVHTLNELLEKSKGSFTMREFLGLAAITRKYFSLYGQEKLDVILLKEKSSDDAAFSGHGEGETARSPKNRMKFALAKFYKGDDSDSDLRNMYNLLNIFHEIGHAVLHLILNECNFGKQVQTDIDGICKPYHNENDLRSKFFRELSGLGMFCKDRKSMDEIDKVFWKTWDGYMYEQMQILGMFLCQDTLFLNTYGDLSLSIAAHEVWPDIAVYLRPTHKEDIDVNDVKRMSTIDNICSENFEKTRSFLQDVRNNNSEGCLFGNFLQSLRDELDGFKAPEELFCISSDKVSEIGEKISRKMNFPLTEEVVGIFDDLCLSPLWSDEFKAFFAEVSKISLKDETFSCEKLNEYLGRYFLLSADDDNREWNKLSMDKKRENARELRIEFEDLREKAEKLIETKDFGAQVDPQLIDNVA